MPVITKKGTDTELKLNSNEIFASLYNMIISQTVFADNIKGTNSRLVDEARTDGTLAGDQKLFYATDVLGSEKWGNDAEAINLLKLHRPSSPDTQAIVLDQFRMIALTVDNYLSKRAWGTEGAFGEFNSCMKSWIRDTKRIYDSTLYNSFIGTNVSKTSTENLSIAKVDGTPYGQIIAQRLADLFVEMEDVSRKFNDFGNLRSYDQSEIKVIWNSKYLNAIRKIDLPSIYHNEKLVDKLGDHVLPSRFFGKIIPTASAKNGGKGDGKTIRSLVEHDYNEGITRDNEAYDKKLHIFPGDLVPTGKAFKDNEAYEVQDKVICKIVTKLPPYMSSMEVGTSFFNPRSLTETNYLIFGYNTLEHLLNYPFITITEA